MSETTRTTELCVLASEAEAMAMEMELRENGITPVVVRTASEAFPGVVDRSGWGTLRVAEGELERAREVLEAWYARDDDDLDEDELARQALEAGGRSEEERHREVASLAPPYRGPGRPTHAEVKEAPPRSMPVSAIVAGVSIALNVGLGAWILEKSDDEVAAGDVVDRDADGRLLAEWRYEEGRAHPSRGSMFDVLGGRTSSYADRDSDGRAELYSTYDRAERLATRSFDASEDGWYERIEGYDREGRLAVEWHDDDEDGRLDVLRVHAGEGREALLLRDADGDGHFESLICDGAPRAIRCP